MPVAVAHGEGYAEFRDAAQLAAAAAAGRRCASSTTRRARPSAIPYNPNGSPQGITGLTTADGRFTILMPHPERVFRTRADVVASRRMGRGFAVDADVPQRAAHGSAERASMRSSSDEVANDADREYGRSTA